MGSRRRQADQARERERAAGRELDPVEIVGRTIGRTFWGKAWCSNLERYSDFANRLPRGRSYVRNGSVIHMSVAEGVVEALVSGSSVYEVKITFTTVSRERWKKICVASVGTIGSLVELLQGRFSAELTKQICAQESGLFPSPREIQLSCSCPDWADMCKHVAAVMYGVGARLDQKPELLFRLRGVNERDLLSGAEVRGAGALAGSAETSGKVLVGADLEELFGLKLGEGEARKAAVKKARKAAVKKVRKAPVKQVRKAAVKQARKAAVKKVRKAAGKQSAGKRAAVKKSAGRKAVGKRAVPAKKGGKRKGGGGTGK